MPNANEELKETADAVKVDLDDYESPEAQNGDIAGAGLVENVVIATAMPQTVTVVMPDSSVSISPFPGPPANEK